MNRADRQIRPSSGCPAVTGMAQRMMATSRFSSISFGGEELAYTDTEPADGKSGLFRVRVFDKLACRPVPDGQLRMNMVSNMPTESSPGGGREQLESPPSLSRRDATDDGNNACRYWSAAPRDSWLPTLVAHVSNQPEGTGGTTSWHIPSVLPTGRDWWCVRTGDGSMGGQKQATIFQ